MRRHAAGTSSIAPLPRLQPQQEANTIEGMLDIEQATCRAFSVEQLRLRVLHGDGTSAPSSSMWCWRERVAQWCYDVIDHIGESRELAYVAMNILDRFTSCRRRCLPADERVYELEAMSALFLAIRLGGTAGNDLRLGHLVAMSRNGIQEKDIAAKGKAMISSLVWDHRLLTPANFVRAFIGHSSMTPMLAENLKDTLLDSALYLAELAVFDPVLARKRPSVVAASATITAIRRLAGPSLEVKLGLIEVVNPASRFGDLSPFEQRMDLVFYQQVSNSQSGRGPHLIPEEYDEQSTERSINLSSPPVVSDSDLISMSLED